MNRELTTPFALNFYSEVENTLRNSKSPYSLGTKCIAELENTVIVLSFKMENEKEDSVFLSYNPVSSVVTMGTRSTYMRVIKKSTVSMNYFLEMHGDVCINSTEQEFEEFNKLGRFDYKHPQLINLLQNMVEKIPNK